MLQDVSAQRQVLSPEAAKRRREEEARYIESRRCPRLRNHRKNNLDAIILTQENGDDLLYGRLMIAKLVNITHTVQYNSYVKYLYINVVVNQLSNWGGTTLYIILKRGQRLGWGTFWKHPGPYFLKILSQDTEDWSRTILSPSIRTILDHTFSLRFLFLLQG